MSAAEFAKAGTQRRSIRLVQLVIGVVCMVMIANLQYGWTLFVNPMNKAHGWIVADIQVAFSIFVALETWLTPVAGWIADRLGPERGPKVVVAFGGVLIAIGWIVNAYAESLSVLYLGACISGIGAGAIYATCVGNSVKWFPDRRGIASGIITAGYGMGAAAFNPLFNSLIGSIGYSETFLWTGITHGALILLSGLVLVNPPAGYKVGAAAAKPNVRRHDLDFTYTEMLRTPQFYFLFVAMLSIGIGGLMVTAQLKPVATNFRISNAALTVALVLTPLANGFSRIMWGWVSDYLGREWTMFTAFSLQAIFLIAATTLGRTGDAIWVVLMVLVFLTWGELYALFPAVLGDLYGSKNSALNYSFLYSAKGFAALLGGGIAATLFEATGTWDYAFYGSAALALVSALMSLSVRRIPLPQKTVARALSVQPSAG